MRLRNFEYVTRRTCWISRIHFVSRVFGMNKNVFKHLKHTSDIILYRCQKENILHYVLCFAEWARIATKRKPCISTYSSITQLLCTSSVICLVGFCRCLGSRSYFFSDPGGLDFGLGSGCFMAVAPFAKPEGYSAKLKNVFVVVVVVCDLVLILPVGSILVNFRFVYLRYMTCETCVARAAWVSQSVYLYGATLAHSPFTPPRFRMVVLRIRWGAIHICLHSVNVCMASSPPRDDGVYEAF